MTSCPLRLYIINATARFNPSFISLKVMASDPYQALTTASYLLLGYHVQAVWPE